MKVLNFGSLNLDFTYQVEHFVQPGETLSADSVRLHCGGKGLNQSVALARAGAQVWHSGKIGQDGQILREFLESEAVHGEYIPLSTLPTGNAIIQVDKTGQNSILLYGGANQTITPEFAEWVIQQFDAGDLLLLQNEINQLPFIMETAHKQRMKIALNPSPANHKLDELPLELVWCFILNEAEGAWLSGETEPAEMINALLRRYPDSRVVLTLGAQGVLYGHKEQRLSHGAYTVPVVDTTAAGDSFTGYFLTGLCEGLSPEQCLELASKAAALAVSREGAAESIPIRSQIQAMDFSAFSVK